MLPRTGVEWAICLLGSAIAYATLFMLLAFGTIFF